MNIKLYNGLPLFSAEINADDMSGVYCVSLVTDPATEMPFYAFSKELLKYSVVDDKEHIVTGVIMLCDTPILRVDDNGDGYYIVYSKETLKFMAEKMLREGFTSSVNIEHDAMKYVDGVNLQEIYIIDREKGIDPQMFKDAPDGTLVGTYKIRNDQVWDMVLRGEVYSFSLEGFFEIKPIENNNNQTNTENKMSKIAKFIKSLVKFGQVETDKAILYWEGDEEIAVGTEVFVGEEEKTVAEDGEYIYEEKTIVVKDGKVVEIREKEEETEEVEKEETVTETEVEAEEEVIVEDPVEPQPEERDINAERIDALEAEVAGLKEAIAGLQAQIAEILSKPAVEPIEEEFEKVTEVNEKGLNKKAQKAVNLFKNYKRK